MSIETPTPRRVEVAAEENPPQAMPDGKQATPFSELELYEIEFYRGLSAEPAMVMATLASRARLIANAEREMHELVRAAAGCQEQLENIEADLLIKTPPEDLGKNETLRRAALRKILLSDTTYHNLAQQKLRLENEQHRLRIERDLQERLYRGERAMLDAVRPV